MLTVSKRFSYFRLCLISLLVVVASSPSSVSANKVVVVPLIEDRSSAIKPQAAVELSRSLTNNNVSTGLSRVFPDGSSPSTYTVPEGKVLVITSVFIDPQTSDADPTVIRLMQDNTSRQTWRVTSNFVSQFSYTPGLIIGAGSSVNAINFTTNSGVVRLSLFGYEVSVE